MLHEETNWVICLSHKYQRDWTIYNYRYRFWSL